jgi:predicted MFS family arabinose efflux permease
MEDKDLSPRVTRYLYLLISFCYLSCNIDVGIFAISPNQISYNLGIDISMVGLLSSAIYMGNVAGTLIGPFLFAKMRAKHVIIAASIVNALFVSSFLVTSNFWILFSTRFITGLAKVMFVIYFPVWIDQHAPPASQTMWISLYFLTVPIGLIIGYFSTSLIIGDNNESNDYRYGFLLQSVLMIFPISVCFMLFPAKYYEQIDEDNKPASSAINEQLSMSVTDKG